MTSPDRRRAGSSQETPAAATLSLRPMDHGRPWKHEKTGEALARRIRDEVIADGWKVGTMLGSEPELLARYGVSRAVLREAIRLLEHSCVARMRAGRNGGLVVTAPEVSTVANAAALLLDYQRVGAADLYHARSAIETKCVELAVERLTSDGVDRLRSVIERESAYSRADLVEHSHELHMAVAELSGDPALTLFMAVLMDLTGESSPPGAVTARHPRGAAHLRRTKLDHAAIAEAIVQRDASRAGELMLRHLRWIERQARAVSTARATGQHA